MRPRLLYIIGQLGLGGYERQLYYLLQTIDRQRFRPAVAVWNSAHVNGYASKIRALGIPLYGFPEKLPRQTRLIALRRLVKTLSPEVVHSYSFYTNFAAWWSTLGTESISVGSIRNNFVSERRQAGNVLGRLSARWPADQICNSLCAKREVGKTVGPFKPSRLHVVSNKLDITSFKAIPSLPRTPVLLAVGRLFPEKRWDRLIKVVAMVASSGMSFHVQLAGEGPLLQILQSQALRLGVDEIIQFLGIRNDIPELLADSTFLIHTADDEGCPNVVMEAMACGRAVVSTDAGDVPYLVEDGKTGFVVERGNNAMLVERMATLIKNRELCLSMGQAGRARAEQEFGLDRLVNETMAAYRSAGWREA